MVDIDGDFVRTRRHILGLTQRELAHRTGMKQPLVAAIESGRRQPARPVLDRAHGEAVPL